MRFVLTMMLMLPSLTMAQTVNVLSGDHPGFSRLVLYLPEAMGFTLSQTQAGAQLKLETPGLNFDTSDVFRRIDTARIASVTPLSGQSGLALRFNCDCEAQAFLDNGSLLVIDVTPKDPNAPQSADVSRQVPRPPTTQNAEMPRTGVIPLFTPTLGPLRQVDPPQVLTRETPVTPTPEVSIGAVEAQLLTQIGRAATQGLLSVDPDIRPNAMPDTMPTPEPGVTLGDLARHSNVATTNSLMRPTQPDLQSHQTAAGHACVADGRLALRNWGDDTPIYSQISALRSRLFGEFDRIDMRAAQDITKVYLHFGFGAEAMHAQTLTGEAPDPVLRAIADVFDRGVARDATFEGQTECDTDAALWSVLASDGLDPGATVSREALLRGFDRLPTHLQDLLGPIASRKLTASGHTDIADALIRRLDRTREEPSDQTIMATAELDLSQGRVEAAKPALEEVVNANVEDSPEALVRLIDTLVSEGHPIAPNLLTLAGSYLEEHEDGDLGPDLHRVLALAFADAGEYANAFGERDQLISARQGPSITLTDQIFGFLTKAARDAEFLQHASREAPQWAARLTPERGNQVAERLLGLGFSDLGLRFLQPAADGLIARDRRLLRAKAHLMADRALEAEEQLIGMAGDDADLIRAEARLAQSDFAAAEALFAALGETDRALTAAWLAGNWSSVAEDTAQPFAPAAQLALDPGTGDAEPLPELARNNALVSESATARQTLRDLLASTEIEGALQSE